MKYGARTHVWRTAILVVAVLGCEVRAKAEAGGTAVLSKREADAAEKAFRGLGSCEAAGLKAPPKRFGLRDSERVLAGSLPIYVYYPESYGKRFAGVIRMNVPGECTGLYLWDRSTETLHDVGNATALHRPPLVVDPATAEEHVTVQGLKLYLSGVAVRRDMVDEMQRQAAGAWGRDTAREASEAREAGRLDAAADAAAVDGGWGRATEPAIAEAPAQEASARYHEPEPASPAPTPRPVIQTVYREVETPSRLMQVVESRVGWLLCGGTVLGILLGLAMRGSGSRQIVISAEEHARAAAQLEQRLRADTMRLRSLSSAVDQEEARYIQRVSAITRRS